MRTWTRTSLCPLVAALLSSAVLAAPARTSAFKLALPGLSYVNVEDKAGDFFLDYFTQQLQQQGGVVVITKRDVATLLGMERQRQLLSCAADSSECTAELTGALGVDGLISGSLAKTDGGFVINLKIIAARDAHPLAVFSTRVKTSEALLDYLQSAARQFISSLPPQPGARRAPISLGGLWFPTVAAGAGLLVVGGGSYAFAKLSEAELRAPNPSNITSPAAFQSIRSRGEVQQTVAFITGGVGLAALGVGALLWKLDPSSHRPSLAVVPLNGGAMLVVSPGASQ